MKKLFLENKNLKIFNTEDYKFFLDSKLNGFKMIGTHSGTFHGDDVLACFMVKHLPAFRDCYIVRTRNYDILKHADLVFDVGGVFDPKTLRYDHHMKEFAEVFDERNIKMSSAGLVYKYHGKDIIKNILSYLDLLKSNEEYLDIIYSKLYENFICYVDATDNGINQYPDNTKPVYINTTDYASRISRVNPNWYEDVPDYVSCFRKGLDIAEDEFITQLGMIVKSYIPSRVMVNESIINRKQIHNSGKIIYLPKNCPWKEHLYNIEIELHILGEIKFVIHPNIHGGYKISTVPLSFGNYKFRKGLKESWRGLMIEDLRTVSGISDISFVHSSGFMGTAKLFESALKMAELSLS